ncbi:MAG: imidazole glycerol phosphate synthase subunit HisH [Candidatus Omnitrophica bacterium]|nr:imidazole glycerol phosphate synthase subunit HisH [Candidatus Omnitrophota bacterium]
MISIIDYGMGNIRSVAKALERLGHPAEILATPPKDYRSELTVLPGVGAFDHAVVELKQRGWWDVLKRIPESDGKLLGMCLGLQLLFERSAEGSQEGLGLIEGDVIGFPDSIQSPHMGWNTAVPANNAWQEILTPKGKDFYFVHSYFVRPKNSEVVAAHTENVITFPSIVHSKNIIATQFHPEKSQENGLTLLNDILELLGVIS